MLFKPEIKDQLRYPLNHTSGNLFWFLGYPSTKTNTSQHKLMSYIPLWHNSQTESISPLQVCLPIIKQSIT